MNKIPWGKADDAAAVAEGWCLSLCARDISERWDIQRIDCPVDAAGDDLPPVFDGDLEAMAYVTMRALEGSDLHIRAIKLDGEPFKRAQV